MYQALIVLLIGAYTVIYTAIDAEALQLLMAPVLFNFKLKELENNENMHPFRPARLADRGGDLKKLWYINYYVWDVQKNAMVRRQEYDINKFKTKVESYAFAKITIEKLNELLQKGFHRDKNKSEKQLKAQNTSLAKAVEIATEIKKGKVAKSSFQNYLTSIEHFTKYIKSEGIDTMPVRNWKKTHAIRYIDFLIKEGDKSASTVNKYRAFLKALFTMLLERDYIQTNPWIGFTKEKVVKTNANMAFTSAEMEKIIERLQNFDPEVLAFVKVMFYTFMRPKEIRYTRVKNVLLNNLKIIIPAEISKNRTRGFVDIPEQLLPTIQGLIQGKSPDEFLFQSKKSKIHGKDTMWNRHREFLIALKLNDGHTLYSWKHTGVVQAYKNGVRIKSIQLQCRHHSIAQTDDYLKSLGIFENTEIKFGMPDLPK